MSERVTRIAVYGGPFDPPTNGHMFIVRMGTFIFDQLIVVVAVNPNKSPLFKTWERVNMLRDLVHKEGLDERVKVVETTDYVGEVAKKYGAQFFVRGIRNVQDAESEMLIADINQRMFPTMQTIMLYAPPSLTTISSSVIKEYIRKGFTVSGMIHPEVEALTRLRMKEKK